MSGLDGASWVRPALSQLSLSQLALYNETDVSNVINYSLTADVSTYVLGYNLVIKQK